MTEVETRLKERILAEGPIPFAVFMEEALYGEGGYYRRAEPRIGRAGDYVTGSSLSPMFGTVTARLLERLWALVLPGESIAYLEAGYGTGAHLSALVEALGERSGDPGPRLVAWDRVRRRVPASVELLESLESSRGAVRGLVFSYELFDALPVHRLIGRRQGPGELWVDLSTAGELEWRPGELSTPELATLPGAELEEGQVADLAPGWRPLYRRLAESLERGLLVTFDYGFETCQLLDPRVRRHGTLACYRRHQVHRNPFVEVGEQDLTAHVDFSSLIAEGERAGLETVVLTRQAAWLAALGLLDGLDRAAPAARAEAMALLDLDGMGEEIRVLVQARGVDASAVLPPELLAP